jgi:hypothetical protein
MADGDYWLHRWRLIFERRRDTEALTLDSTAELAARIRASQHDPQITSRRHFRVKEWIGPEPDHTCVSGLRGWTRQDVTPCCCGVEHRRFKCTRCQIDETLPERGDGCGTLPWVDADPDRWAD